VANLGEDQVYWFSTQPAMKLCLLSRRRWQQSDRDSGFIELPITDWRLLAALKPLQRDCHWITVGWHLSKPAVSRFGI